MAKTPQERLEYIRSWRKKNYERLHLKYKADYAKNKKAILERNKKWLQENLEKSKEYRRKWLLRNGDRSLKYRLKSRFGLTVEAYIEMFSAQGGMCAICGYKPVEIKERLNVDHDHATGKVRGLLCPNCNKSLGLIRDSIETALKMAEYLKRSLDSKKER
ncbi:MAG TPA: endonuclease VII domain-containing protein [Anaerolineales bacterium]|nr:endonuclease VII domain-containing protein [Anaerolineales bacterium]